MANYHPGKDIEEEAKPTMKLLSDLFEILTPFFELFKTIVAKNLQ